MKRRNYNKFDAGSGFLYGLISPVFITAVMLLIIMLLGSTFGFDTSFLSDDKNVLTNIFSILCSQLSFLAVFLIYNKYKKIDTKRACNINFKFGVKNYLIIALIVVVALVGMNYFITLFDNFFEFIGYKQPGELPIPVDNFWWFLLNVVLLAVLPAICEELLFRGIIFNGLKNYGNITAIFGSAALFSLFHTSPLQTIYPFLFGLVLALIVYKSGSLIASIFAHLLSNLLVVVLTYVEVTTGFALPVITGALWPLWVILIGVSAGVIIWLLLKLIKNKNTTTSVKLEDIPEELPAEVVVEQKGINKQLWLGVLIGVAMWVYILVYYLII